MERIFSYLSYREFLKHRFEFFKKTRRGFTYRSFSKKAGFRSPNFLKLIIDGQRNLTEQSLEKVAKAFELEPKETEFFRALVQFNQAKNFTQKESAYLVLQALQRKLALQFLGSEKLSYFDPWYQVVIREMVEIDGFKEDAAWVQKRLKQKIPLHEIRRVFERLQNFGLLERDLNGCLKSKQATVSTGDEVQSVATRRFHQTMILKAKEALDSDPSKRDITSLTIAVSEEVFLKIKERLKQFRKEILALANNQDGVSTEVYQLNLQFFSLTECL